MDIIGYVMDLKGILGLIAGVALLIVIGNLILGGSAEREDAGAESDWDAGEAGDGQDDEAMDVMVATRALLVPDPYDGRHLYVELDDGDVIHLCGRWLDDYHVGEPAAAFPCESFRPYADWEDPFDLEHPYRVECLGAPLPPILADEPLSSDARRDGLAPADWERVHVSFDRLLRRLAPRGATSPVPPEQIAALEDAFERSGHPVDRPVPRPAQPSGPPASASRASSPPAEPAQSWSPPVSGSDEPLFSTSRDADAPADIPPLDSFIDDEPPDAEALPDESPGAEGIAGGPVDEGDVPDVPQASEDG